MNLIGLISSWFENIRKGTLPTPKISALNIGIVETESGYSLYLTGSKNYDQNDNDWCCVVDYEPLPKDKYLPLPAELVTGKQWTEILAMVITALNEVIALYPAITQGRAVTTGFDDGDLVKIA